MKAEDTLQYMADFYPDVFPTRKHALNHLFCVIGNGYEWVNGELVDNDDIYGKRYKLRKPIEKAEFINEEFWKYQRKFYENLYEAIEEEIPAEYWFKWYPLSRECSKLYNYPDNIKSDWKELLDECKSILISDGIEI